MHNWRRFLSTFLVAGAALTALSVLPAAAQSADPFAGFSPGVLAAAASSAATVTAEVTPSVPATPVPGPSGVAVETKVVILNPDSTFIPPSERTATNHVTWNAIAGFTGSYEVERFIDLPLANSIFVRVASVDSSSAVNGKLEYAEDLPFLESTSIKRCYRVRAVSGAQVNAFSEQACTQLPPRSGGGDTSSADPFAGLSPGVLAAARAVDSGNAQALAALVPAAGATRTAFPGDGTPVDRATAVAAITAALVNNTAASDAIGSGGYRLLAIWIPSVQPAEVVLAGSGIDASGKRVTTIFVVPKDGSTLLGYGRAVDTASVLDQFAGQGDLRRIPQGTHPPAATPGAPTVGTGSAPAPRDEVPYAALGLLTAGAGLAGFALSRRHRGSRA